jgi:hypothetical protein
MRALLIFTIILFLLNACRDPDVLVKGRDYINISESDMPASASVNQIVEIQLKAEATDGCWSNLMITMNALDGHHFLFTATGYFETDGICPAMMVYQDSLIRFLPLQKGHYFFQINKSPFPVMRDTLEVN